MTSRRLTITASHPDGRLRLVDLRDLVDLAGENAAHWEDVIDDSALVVFSTPWWRRWWRRGKGSVTLIENEQERGR